jgi:hypothetical protein
MGKTRNLLMAVLMGTALLASCRKDKDKDRNVVPLAPTNTTSNSTDPSNVNGMGQTSDLHYKVTAGDLDIDNLPSLFTWTEGYINLTRLHFEGNLLDPDKNKDKGKGNGNPNGNAVTHVHYKTDVAKQVDLLSATTVGDIDIPLGTYSNVMVKLQMAPMGNVHTMYLEGAVVYAGLTVPVMVIVDESVDVMAKWNNQVTITDNADYWSDIMLSLDQLAANIDESMLQNLQFTNGTIVISSTSNANIYSMLVTNMQGMLKVKIK